MRHCRRACFITLLVVPSLLGTAEDDVKEISPLELTQAVRSCRGPYGVFMSSGDLADEAESDSALAFGGVAEMFVGVACFSILRCDQSPVFCADLNVRRTPAVIVYPPGSGAAQLLTGALDKQEIAAGIARPISVADRALVLNAENMEIFLKDSLRPVKVILFSSRKTTPVILQALSSDPELWPYVRFGFVKHSENSILTQFKVTEVPHIVLQHGSNISTRESFIGGTMTIEALRGWIKGHVQASAVDPGEDGIFRAVEGASLLEEPMIDFPDDEEDGESDTSAPAPAGKSKFGYTIGDTAGWTGTDEDVPAGAKGKVVGFTDDKVLVQFPKGSWAFRPTELMKAASSPRPGPKPGSGSGKKPGPSPAPQRKVSANYKLMKRGSEGCPDGLEILTLEECFKAAEELGIRAQPPWIATYPGLPRFCSIREKPSGGDKERMHFNSAAEGSGRADLSPICLVAPHGGSWQHVGEPTAEQVPQLNAATKDLLLAHEGFSLVYLREGKLTPGEIAMLMDLEEQFRPQLESQGTKMNWMWMDLHVERKFKAHFDPPALPSAVVLNPHKRPRFAMVKHSEDAEGEPMPTDQPAIALLLNTVLGGDAQFSPLPAKALTKFAEQ